MNGQPTSNEHEHPNYVRHDLGSGRVVPQDHQSTKYVAGGRAGVAGYKGVDGGCPHASSPGDGGSKKRQHTGDQAATDPYFGTNLAGARAKVNEHHKGEPGKKRPRFHRIPSPIAAPIENQIGPQPAKSDAECCHEQPRASQMEHAWAEFFCFIGEGSGHRDGREVQTERIRQENEGRVNHHEVRLKQRIEAGADEEGWCFLERVE